MISTNSDGGSRGNPGRGAIGTIIRDEEKILKRHGEKIGTCTNNMAEYLALIKALELASEFTKDEITSFLDSELVVRQVLGKYEVRNGKLRPLHLKVLELTKNFRRVYYVHVPRDDRFQKIADGILNAELDGT